MKAASINPATHKTKYFNLGSIFKEAFPHLSACSPKNIWRNLEEYWQDRVSVALQLFCRKTQPLNDCSKLLESLKIFFINSFHFGFWCSCVVELSARLERKRWRRRRRRWSGGQRGRKGWGRQRRGSRGAGEWRRGDKASGTDRGMNNLSTLLMDRLGEKMKRDEAREREREERGAGGRGGGSEIESRGRGGIKWQTEREEESKWRVEGPHTGALWS